MGKVSIGVTCQKARLIIKESITQNNELLD